MVQFSRNFCTNSTHAYWLKSFVVCVNSSWPASYTTYQTGVPLARTALNHRFGLIEGHAHVFRALSDEERNLQLRRMGQRRNALEELPASPDLPDSPYSRQPITLPCRVGAVEKRHEVAQAKTRERASDADPRRQWPRQT